MRSRFVLGLALFLALAPASLARAACIQTTSSLKGTWQIYAGGVDVFAVPYWIRCKAVVQTNGTLSTGKPCKDNLGDSYTITGGKLTLNATTCAVTGNIQISIDPTANAINHATLNLQQDLVTGVGTDFSGGAFVFNMVRQ